MCYQEKIQRFQIEQDYIWMVPKEFLWLWNLHCPYHKIQDHRDCYSSVIHLSGFSFSVFQSTHCPALVFSPLVHYPTKMFATSLVNSCHFCSHYCSVFLITYVARQCAVVAQQYCCITVILLLYSEYYWTDSVNASWNIF